MPDTMRPMQLKSPRGRFSFAALMRWAAILVLLAGFGLVLRDVWPHRTTRFIIDADQRIVIYHGVNIANHSKSTPDRVPLTTREDFQWLHGKGFNLVRYLIFWEAIEPERGRIDHEYLRKTMERVDQLEGLGIDVLLDFHQDLYAQRFGGNGFPEWTVNEGGKPFTRQTPWHRNYWQPAVWHSYDTFWRSRDLQDRYAEAVMLVLRLVEDRPNVIGLDIMNEPWPWKGLGFERRMLGPFYARIAELRENEKLRVPLFFAPMLPTNTGFRSGLRDAPGKDSVFAIHYYDAMVDGGAPYRWWNWLLMWRTVRVKVGEAERMKVPLFVGEFGLPSSNPGFHKYLGDFTGLLEQRGVGWAYWSYDRGPFGFLDPKGEPGPALKSLVQVYAQRIAGRRPKIERTTQTFQLSYDPISTTAPTIIFLPPSLTIRTITINGREISKPSGSELRHANPKTHERQTIRIEWE